jgi:hypothetical protein
MLGFIPLNSTVTIVRKGVDSWGIDSGVLSETKVKAVIDYDGYKVTQLNGNARGTEASGTAVILMKGKVDVKYSDTIKFDGYELQPRRIEYIRDFGGRIIYTRVAV